jgi:PAS domain S-box-containing protein
VKVLIADDDPVTLELLTRLFSEWGYDPVAVRTGSEALRLLSAMCAPRLAVLDWMLPDIYGMEICRCLRASQSLDYTYLILILPTDRDESTDIVEGLGAGADDYLRKPYDPLELRARLDTGSRIVVQKALHESERRFQAAFEHAGIGMALMDISGKWLQVNRALCNFLGYASSELLTTNFQALTHPDDLSRGVQSLKDFVDGNLGVFQMEKRYIHKSGHVVWGLLTASPISNREGRPAYLVVQVQDISQRKEAEEALREREAQLQLLLDSTAEGIYGLNLEGNCTFSNSACLKLLGYGNASDLLGKNMHTLLHPRYADGSPYPVEQCSIHNGREECAHVDCDVKWKANGTSYYVACWSHQVRREGKALGSVVTFVDITSRRWAEEGLRAEHTESELFINSVPSILIGTDACGQITRWNLAAAKAFSLPASAVSGRSLKNCGIKWVTPTTEAEIDSWIRIEELPRNIELPFEKAGERRFLGLTVNRVMFAHEESFGLLITGADITERILLEQQLRQAQKLEAIGQLAAGIAHEINTPTQYVGDNNTFIKESWSSISSVARAAQRLDDESKTEAISGEALATLTRCIDEADLPYLLEEIPKAIDQSLEGVHRVAKIVRAMKEFSHPSSEEKTALDINRAIETTITVARNEWKYVCDVETFFDPGLPLVPCHAGELNQTILNLVINAAHAIRQVVSDGVSKGKIRITTRQDLDQVEISIEDTGCGIPEEIQSRIFEPFFTTKPVGQGTGQGLALAHTTIVRRHDGRLWFETIAGKGTTFFIRLPVAPATAEF